MLKRDSLVPGECIWERISLENVDGIGENREIRRSVERIDHVVVVVLILLSSNKIGEAVHVTRR